MLAYLKKKKNKVSQRVKWVGKGGGQCFCVGRGRKEREKCPFNSE